MVQGFAAWPWHPEHALLLGASCKCGSLVLDLGHKRSQLSTMLDLST